MIFKKLLFFFTICVPFSLHAEEKPKLCLVLDEAGKYDHGFNQAASEEFERLKSQGIIDPKSITFEGKSQFQIEQVFRAFSVKCDGVISVGVNNNEILKRVISKYKDQKFFALDDIVEGPNVRSLVFREDQGAFLMGAIAALKSKTGKIGFIGGMDIPVIRRFQMAYEAGAKYVNPKIQVQTSYVGITVSAWNDPTKAEELAFSQYVNGVDVIFHAAGGSGLGVFEAGKKFSLQKKPVFVIGCDANQNGLGPKVALASLVKNVGKFIQDTAQQIKTQQFKPGIVVYDLQNKGIYWALDKYNQPHFTPSDLKYIEQIKSDIVSARVVVPDYYKQRRP